MYTAIYLMYFTDHVATKKASVSEYREKKPHGLCPKTIEEKLESEGKALPVLHRDHGGKQVLREGN